MSAVTSFVLRVVNEALPLAGIVLGLLVVTGHLTPEQADGWEQWFLGATTWLATLLARQNFDGPVTLARKRR